MPAPVSMRTGSRRPTRYVFVPGPVIMPGLSPSTRPTRGVRVAVRGNALSIQLMGSDRTPDTLLRRSDPEVAVLDVLARGEIRGGAAPDDAPLLEHVVGIGDPGERT